MADARLPDTAASGAGDAAEETACLSLGANLGDREQTIGCALKLIAASPGIHLIAVSSLYRTAPVGYHDQPEFINSCAVIGTSRSPERLLGRLKAIERVLGRRKRSRWHEREIDIDILLMGDRVHATADVTIPHPEMHRRAFVLVPLAEIAPSMRHPVLGRTIAELAEDAPGLADVRLADDPIQRARE